MHKFGLNKSKGKAKRVGRGYGSGKGGHTATRGTKGQKSRTGYKSPRKGFEGGSMPLSRRIPKLRGFSRRWAQNKSKNIELNISKLNGIYSEGEVVNISTLTQKGYRLPLGKSFRVKILGNGILTKKLTIENLDISASAKSKIESAGGKVIIDTAKM